MEDLYNFTTTEEERAARRAERIAARKQREKARRKKMLLQSIPVAALFLVAAGVLVRYAAPASSAEGSAHAADVPAAQEEPISVPMTPLVPAEPVYYTVKADGKTVTLTDQIDSEYAVLIDLQTDTILAQKDPDTVIHPASMTKILTVLTAAEHVEDLTGTAKIDIAITDYCFSNDCSVVGYLLDEEVPAEELFYGTILSSGADAALALANYAAGSHEAFVELMNEKVAELGLSDTARFANCVGLYNEDNVCTVTDMALILKAAMDNELCRKVLTTRVYTGQPVEDYPEGRILSNWFIRNIEDMDTGDIKVLGAKTGYVVKSGNCAASYGQDSAGNSYICVTAKAGSSKLARRDHMILYAGLSQAIESKEANGS